MKTMEESIAIDDGDAFDACVCILHRIGINVMKLSQLNRIQAKVLRWLGAGYGLL